MPSPTFASASSTGGGTRSATDLTIPSGVVAGSLVLVHISAETTGAVTAPSGFTEVSFPSAPVTSGGQTFRLRVFWRLASGTESGTYRFTHTSTWTRAAAIRVEGAAASDPIQVVASGATSSSTTALPTLSGTVSAPQTLLVWGGGAYEGGGSWNTPSQMVQRVNAGELAVATQELSSAGATGNLAASKTTGSAKVATAVAVRSPAQSRAKVWTGSTWRDVIPQVWTGSTWRDAPLTVS